MHRHRWQNSEKNHILFPEVGQKRHFTTATSVFLSLPLCVLVKAECLGLWPLCAQAWGHVRVGGWEILRLRRVKGVFKCNWFEELLSRRAHSKERVIFWRRGSEHPLKFRDYSVQYSFNLSHLGLWQLMTTVTQKETKKLSQCVIWLAYYPKELAEFLTRFTWNMNETHKTFY